jgi:mannose-6-phosphate isomerase-like protein (cupin superfamily)
MHIFSTATSSKVCIGSNGNVMMTELFRRMRVLADRLRTAVAFALRTGKDDLTDQSMHFVEKGWGSETWIVNEEYCGKLLKLNKGKMLSWHTHLLKREHFWLASGCVKVIYGWDDDIGTAKEFVMRPGMRFCVPTGLNHRLVALEDSEVIEFSTTHYDKDSYRLIKGD